MANARVIPPRSGAGVEPRKGQTLTVIDPAGEQVSDLVAFNANDREEYISSRRSIDYAGRIFLTTRDILYSNRSNPMLTIIQDEVGRRDFLLTTCSKEVLSTIYKDEHPHHGCQGNLEMAFTIPDTFQRNSRPSRRRCFLERVRRRHVAVEPKDAVAVRSYAWLFARGKANADTMADVSSGSGLGTETGRDPEEFSHAKAPAPSPHSFAARTKRLQSRAISHLPRPSDGPHEPRPLLRGRISYE